MSEEMKLVTELAIILIAAGVFTIISRALKQPVILGYIVAGFLVGPNLGLFPQFSPESVKEWSELGIIFMLFSLGLEFSFKKLLKIGSRALITAVTICVGMMMVGLTAGPLMGWSVMESLFLGGMLSMSSTAIILKSYNEMGLRKTPHASLLFGILVFEDLIAVLLMVLLSTMAVSNRFSGGEMLLAFTKLAFFLILCFLTGIYVLPTLLARTRRFLNDEILLLASIGLCFAMVVLANKVGFSSAIGAFIMGSLLAETIEGEKIHHITTNIKDLFGAIFFVSVGMMVNPSVIGEHLGMILVITILAMGGILLFSTGGVILSGGSLSNAVRTGFSLSQLGEFSFIIAGVGTSLGVLSDFIYPVIIAVSVITIFLTPFMIKAAEPALNLLHRRLPARWVERLEARDQEEAGKSKAEKSEWKHLLKSYFLRVGLYSILLFTILVVFHYLFNNLKGTLLASMSPDLQSLVATLVTLGVMSPFLLGLSVTGGSISKPAAKLLKEKRSNAWRILALLLLRVALGTFFVIIAIEDHVSLSWWVILVIVLSVFVGFLYARSSMQKIGGIEKRFLANLNEKEEYQRKVFPVSSSVQEKLKGYDIQIEKVTLSGDFYYAGKTLREMPFRVSSGANIVKIMRGSKSILVPSGDEILFPGDKILAVGTKEQLESFRQCIKENSEPSDAVPDEFALECITVGAGSILEGKSLRESDLRGAGCLVISIIREDDVITNPSPDTVFHDGDAVWIAGEKSSVEWFK